MYTEKEFVAIVKFTPGAKIICKVGKVYLLSVRYQTACKTLFDIDSVNWCIARSKHHWDEYITNRGNKQYFIVDFNNVNTDCSDYTAYNCAFIGFTVDKYGAIYAAHARDDYNLLDNRKNGMTLFESILKDKGIYNLIIDSNGCFTSPKKMPKKEVEMDGASMVPVYFLIGAIILASLTLFLR